MARYIHLFETEDGFNTVYNGEGYKEPWVSLTMDVGRVNYNKTLLEMPFTVEALGEGTLSWNLGNRTLQYSKNSGEWSTMDNTTRIEVVEGDTVSFKGSIVNYSNCAISCTSQFNVKGNIMSLINGDNYASADTISVKNFGDIFRGSSALVSAANLILPATTLTDFCYSSMFYGCTSLTTAPQLPATTLAGSCYQFMFYGCTSLTQAPELPATTLAYNCYSSMFYGCTSLTQAPELPATNLVDRCYSAMFQECTSLTTAPELPATTLAQSCYWNMFYGCTSLTAAPELPATTLTDRCYNYMFFACTNLNYIKCLATDISASDCTNHWVNGVASTGTFVKAASMTGWPRGTSGIPANWTVQDA